MFTRRFAAETIVHDAEAAWGTLNWLQLWESNDAETSDSSPLRCLSLDV
jgi:hypothetical protein